jgi:hypothetical protein
MNYSDKYIKYKTKYLNWKNVNNMIGGGSSNNFIIIGNTRGKLDYLSDLKKYLKQLKNNVCCQYKFKFTNKRYVLDDLTFENVSADIKSFLDKKKLTSNNIIICLEESAPFGLFFVNMYPDYCSAIICYPLRLNTKESLDRLYHKYVKKKRLGIYK